MPTSGSSRSYFTGLAEGYNRHRPSYAPAAIDALLAGLAPPLRAASIGCGTGICCRLLAARAVDVTGIDPNRDMLEEARRHLRPEAGGIAYRLGTAEDTGLPAASLNLVLCAQSFHWFDSEAALAEFHRILRPDGRLALMWNVRCREDPFSLAYSRIARRAQEHSQATGRTTPQARGVDPTVTGRFRITGQASFANPQTLNESALLGRLHSASYYPKTGPVKEELDREARAAFAQYASKGEVILQQRTEVTLAGRL